MSCNLIRFISWIYTGTGSDPCLGTDSDLFTESVTKSDTCPKCNSCCEADFDSFPDPYHESDACIEND